MQRSTRELVANSVARRLKRSGLDQTMLDQTMPHHMINYVKRTWLKAARKRFSRKERITSTSSTSTKPAIDRNMWRKYRREEEDWQPSVIICPKRKRQSEESKAARREKQKIKKLEKKAERLESFALTDIVSPSVADTGAPKKKKRKRR